ncbi:MAG TPA: alpha/beta fold hydrolase [Acidimicrobiales bacterium]
MASIDRNGVRIAYEVHGSAGRTPVLLSHGYSASSGMWSANLAALSADRQVVTWDMRGHGHSDSPGDPSAYSQAASVDDMAAVLDACGMTRAVVGGLSLGGYLSLAFHRAHPGRVAGLLLFDTGPGFTRDDARLEWNAWAESMAESFDRAGTAALPAIPEAGTGPQNPPGLALAARGILPQDDDAVIRSLPSIGVPTLVVVGAHDHPFLKAADYMTARIPGARKVVIAASGHVPNMENPSAFNDAVTAFLTEIA